MTDHARTMAARARQLRIAIILADGQRHTIYSLARTIGCSHKAIEHDIETMTMLLVDLCEDDRGGITLVPTDQM